LAKETLVNGSVVGPLELQVDPARPGFLKLRNVRGIGFSQ
jgi:hypothetical protein